MPERGECRNTTTNQCEEVIEVTAEYHPIEGGKFRPHSPCPHRPGSPGKVYWLVERAATGEPLFRKDDAK